MRKKGDSQLSLNLPVPPTSNSEAKADPPQVDTRPHALVYSLSDMREDKEKRETTKHFHDLLELVRHFR